MDSHYLKSYVIFLLICSCNSQQTCDKTPAGIQGPRNRQVGGRYYIEIPGNPKNYTPGQRYNISLKAIPKYAFKNFVLTIEPENNDNGEYDIGRLDLGEETITDLFAKFSPQCRDTIIESSVVPKSEIQAFWTAPQKNSGCVVIKAAVVESKTEWFADDSALTKVLCEEKIVDENIQPRVLSRCCACQEAKYEVAFEGKWTRNTHPRHFPANLWNTGFSEVIGASHQLNQAFWKYEENASEGLKVLAETERTETLESELKNNSEHIRTIIKARGLQYPNITKSTYAVFRVDNKNHLVSLVSKIIPSPDWIVGVSNLELCRPDCTWEESRTLNLYPWDVGTNDGLGYLSWASTPETHPITRITANNPNNPESPFYDEYGNEMKPLAKLHLTRQRLYEKTCDFSNMPESENCATTDWSKWSPCSKRCGKGVMYRTREFLEKDATRSCNTDLVETQKCIGTFCSHKSSKVVLEEAAGTTEETTEEAKEETTEEAGTFSENEDDPNCPGTVWGTWSACNVSCGNGYRSRFRVIKEETTTTEEDMQACFKGETEECVGTECDKDSETNDRKSNLESDSFLVSQGPDGEVIDCEVTLWGKWSRCIFLEADATCGDGYQIKSRHIRTHPSNGGNACPKALLKKKKCRIPCGNRCTMSKWSNWSPCSSNCGVSAVQVRTRNIVLQPPGVDCKEPRVETRSCKLPLACSDSGEPIYH